MRSLRSQFVSACALTIASVTAAVLPGRGVGASRPDGKLLHYEFHPDYAQATFSVPCSGCLGSAHDTDQDDESLLLTFTSGAQDEACGSSNITLNGVQLYQEWDGEFATGSGAYTAAGATGLQQDAHSLQRDLDLEWNSTCLYGEEDADEPAQILTVRIKAIHGKPLALPSGFTVSFKQQTSPPSLLRFESVPNLSPSTTEAAQYWRDPPAHLRLVASNTPSTESSTSLEQSLEDDLHELRALQADLQKLQQAIAKKKGRINAKLRQEVGSLTEEINKCEGLACIFKALAHKVHGAWKAGTVCCKSEQTNDMGRPSQDIYAQGRMNSAQKSGGSIKVETIRIQPYEQAADELPPRPTKTSPYTIALEVTLGLICCGGLLAVIRHKCSSLRTRTERAAAREERDTAAAYRRAARKHAWRNWWLGNWRKDRERMEDYEEKRSLIQEQESILEDAMQAEIRQLRAAHDIVHDLVRVAEEGRIGHTPCNYHPPYSPSVASTYPPTTISSEVPSRPLSRTDSLPSYRSNPPSEPPSYESDVDMSQVVANGFRRYTTSSTLSEAISHWTPDSSVVDVSPRPSAETLRYPQSIFTWSEDSEESDVD